jgi:hypothetical protein
VSWQIINSVNGYAMGADFSRLVTFLDCSIASEILEGEYSCVAYRYAYKKMRRVVKSGVSW